jgi:hypothetical protein
VNASTVTYLDKDGDKVTVKFSKPLLTAGNVNNVFHFDTGMVDDGIAELQQLRYLELSALATNGLGVTFNVARSSTGDGPTTQPKIFTCPIFATTRTLASPAPAILPERLPLPLATSCAIFTGRGRLR